MSAPVAERGRAGARTATIPAQRGEPAERAAGRSGLPADQKAGQRSARRAYARRDDRLRRLVGGRPVRTSAPTGRAQFVLLIMALLAIGLVATLWFSTAAAADSYRLQDARAEALALSQQAERLHREVAVLESPPELARRAADLGMVQVEDPARLVVAPDGGVAVVGEPRTAAGQPRPQPAAPPAAPETPSQETPSPETAVPPAGPAPEQLASGPDGQVDEDRDGEPAVVAQGAEAHRNDAPAEESTSTGQGTGPG